MSERLSVSVQRTTDKRVYWQADRGTSTLGEPGEWFSMTPEAQEARLHAVVAAMRTDEVVPHAVEQLTALALLSALGLVEQ